VIRSLNAANECKVVHGLFVAAFRRAWSGLVSNFAFRVLYPDEKSLGQWILGDRAREWPAKAAVLERQGLPAIFSSAVWSKFAYFESGLHQANGV
jgi:hypothetical protein